MTFALYVLVFAAGFGLRAALNPPRPVVVVHRERMPWIERNGVRERLDWGTEHISELLSRLAAAERERRTLIDLLADKRLDEVSADRSLRVVRGERA